MDWMITQTGFLADDFADRGNRFLIGNGYLGVRGTLEEDTKEKLPAVNLAGLYDRVGEGWREPLIAPNPFYGFLELYGEKLLPESPRTLEHMQTLDYMHGEMRRATRWRASSSSLTMKTVRFVSRTQKHLSGWHCVLSAGQDPVRFRLYLGIDGDVWDIHGPHYDSLRFGQTGMSMICEASVQKSDKKVITGRRLFLPEGLEPAWIQNEKSALYALEMTLKPGESLCFSSVHAIFTSQDAADPKGAACAALESLPEDAFEELRTESASAWEKLWDICRVEIDGDADAQEAVNYSLYHLNCIAPPEHSGWSIPARGLSGQTYKGAIFWDTEMFMLDYFLHTQPAVARSLIEYRIGTLPGAMEKAHSYGYEGAFYAWESQEGGFDACSDYNVTDVFTGRPMRTYFRDKQVHISAAVVHAIWRYVQATEDFSLLAEGGARVLAECARFYLSLLVKPLFKDRYELWDVIGPDEYHERVNNNAYTNRMALHTLQCAQESAKALQGFSAELFEEFCTETGWEKLLPQIQDAALKLYIPQPDETGVIEQFDRYASLQDLSLEQVRDLLKDPREYWGGAYGVASDTQIIKQADVVTMLEVFHAEYPVPVLKANWEFYEPRTEHGSSLSACMYALLACRFGEPQRAYPFFMKSATAEIRGGGKQWAGLVYIGGTHPAAAGGAWKALIQGFCGLDITGKEPVLIPHLPSGWKKVRFKFYSKGRLYQAEATPSGGTALRLA